MHIYIYSKQPGVCKLLSTPLNKTCRFWAPKRALSHNDNPEIPVAVPGHSEKCNEAPSRHSRSHTGFDGS